MDDLTESMAVLAGQGSGHKRGRTFRLIVLPFKLVWIGFAAGLKAGWWTAKVPVRVSAKATRTLGIKAVILFAAGIAIGLLFAPGPGSALRDRLMRKAQGGGLTDAELADRVGFELAHAPRTWHLPQPEVAVLQGRVELRGTVPHDRGREELERVAAAVTGVDGVVNELIVTEDAAAEDAAAE